MRFKSSMILCCTIGLTVPDISKENAVFIFSETVQR